MQEQIRGSCHRLAKVDHQGFRAVFLHGFAKVQHRFPGTEGVHQSSDAAVDTSLLRQSRILFIRAGKSPSIHGKAAGRLYVSGIKDAIRPLQHL